MVAFIVTSLLPRPHNSVCLFIILLGHGALARGPIQYNATCTVRNTKNNPHNIIHDDSLTAWWRSWVRWECLQVPEMSSQLSVQGWNKRIQVDTKTNFRSMTHS